MEFEHRKRLSKALELEKESTRKAKVAGEVKNAFLANMSHDIRTPMNAIIGFSDIIAEHPDDEEIVKNAISKIQASGEILLKIINDVLDLSKIESGKAENVETVTDLKQMEENLKMMLEYSIQKGMIDFKVEDQIENPLVWCDVTKLQQVLVNVLNNAVKFTPAGGTITFSCVQRMIAPGFAEYKFTIKDTGIGMTEEFQKHAFEAFERERTSTESKTEGTGLGLAIVKKLVDDYSWNFDVAHENNDESIFEVQFVGVLNTGFNPGFVDSGLFNDVRCKMCIMNRSRNSNSSAQVMHNWLYDKFVASKTVTGETDPRMFGSFVFNDNVSEIIRPKGMKVTFLEGKDWEAEMGSKEGTFGEQYELAMGYKMCSRKWLDWTLPPTDDAGGHFFNGRAQGVNWRMIRYSDVLLMYAEAVVMGGKATANITPLEAINKVRDRVGVPHVTEANMRTIEDERILELTYEGFRFFDLLRWGKVVERFRELENTDPLFKRFSRAQYMGFKENKNEWVPLPIDEVEGNPYITKNNPGW